MIKTKTPRNETVYWVGPPGARRTPGRGPIFTLSRPTACRSHRCRWTLLHQQQIPAIQTWLAAKECSRKTRGIGMNSQRTREPHGRAAAGEGNTDEAVLAAMAHSAPYFHRGSARSRAYEDTALPIGFEQTQSRNPSWWPHDRAFAEKRPWETCSKSYRLRIQRPLLRGSQQKLFGRAHCGIAGKARRQLRPLRLCKLRLVARRRDAGIARGSAFRRHHRPRRLAAPRVSRCAFAAAGAGWQNDCARGSGIRRCFSPHRAGSERIHGKMARRRAFRTIWRGGKQ